MWEYFICVLLILVIFWWFERRRQYETFWKYMLEIPGPPAYPIFGCLGAFSITDSVSAFKRDREYAKIYNPIYKLWAFNLSYVALTGPEDIEKVLSNPKNNTKGSDYDLLYDWLGNGLLNSTGPKWQNRRKILTPAFHFKILQEFVGIFNSSLEGLLAHLREHLDKEYVELNKPVTQFTINAIGETSMGLNFKNDSRCEAYRNAVGQYCRILIERINKVWLRSDFLLSLTAAGKIKNKAVETLHEFSYDVIKERHNMFKDGTIAYTKDKKMAMLDLIISAKYQGADITDEGIREEVDTFMLGGHDTTAGAIYFALMAFANEQEVQEEAYQEIVSIVGESNKNPTYTELGELKYLERCIKEVLRLYPSAATISRIAGEEIKTTDGYTIPKGANIGIFIYDLHRNPKVWEDPEKFDPDRFLPENIAARHPYSFIPFSAGPRNCIGQKYAMLEIKAALCGILRDFKLMPVDSPNDLEYTVDIVLRPIRSVRVKLQPRSRQ